MARGPWADEKRANTSADWLFAAQAESLAQRIREYYRDPRVEVWTEAVPSRERYTRDQRIIHVVRSNLGQLMSESWSR